MFSDRELKLFKQYNNNTPHALKSARGWGKYFKENAARPVGAYDAKPARSRNPTFAEVCKYGRMAFDAEFERRGGNVIGPSGKETPECLEDADPAAQAEVESTVDNQPDHGAKGAAPPWGEHDEPRHERVTEPRQAFDPPVSEAQRKAMGAAASGHSRLGIPREVGERFLHEDAALGEIETGQQGREVGPELWERTRGRDQAEHEDQREDEKLIRRVLTKLGFKASDIDEAIARDRRGRRRMAGDRALARRSFNQMYDAERLTGHGSGAMVITPRVFVHRSRG
jgi:hypothetical protein